MSSSILVQRVISPSDRLVDDATNLMVSTMEGEPASLAMTGGDISIFPLQARAMIREGITWGEFWTAEEDGELVGFMTWTPPGGEPKIPKDERAKIYEDFLDALSDEGREYWSAFGKQFRDVLTECLGENGKNLGWWLRLAMVHPDRKGRGIARKLFEPMREKAAERNEHIACSTTTSLNVTIYQALGFELRGSRTMPCKWGDWTLYVLQMQP